MTTHACPKESSKIWIWVAVIAINVGHRSKRVTVASFYEIQLKWTCPFTRHLKSLPCRRFTLAVFASKVREAHYLTWSRLASVRDRSSFLFLQRLYARPLLVTRSAEHFLWVTFTLATASYVPTDSYTSRTPTGKTFAVSAKASSTSETVFNFEKYVH